MPNVSNLIKTIQDIMRKDAGVDGDAQRLAQLGWMFFLKIFDDREKEMEVLRDNYKSPPPAPSNLPPIAPALIPVSYILSISEFVIVFSICFFNSH